MTSVAQASGSGRGSDCDTMASPKKTPTKRKLEGNPKPSPKRSKPVCKYGPKCYQANPKHMEEFEHPWASSNVCDTSAVGIDVYNMCTKQCLTMHNYVTEKKCAPNLVYIYSTEFVGVCTCR